MIPLNRADIRPASAPLAIEFWAGGANYIVVVAGRIVHLDPGGQNAWSEDDAEMMAAELGGVAVDLRAEERQPDPVCCLCVTRITGSVIERGSKTLCWACNESGLSEDDLRADDRESCNDCGAEVSGYHQCSRAPEGDDL